jgi:hypothetical protein
MRSTNGLGVPDGEGLGGAEAMLDRLLATEHHDDPWPNPATGGVSNAGVA